jgi:hypothetical protein
VTNSRIVAIESTVKAHMPLVKLCARDLWSVATGKASGTRCRTMLTGLLSATCFEVFHEADESVDAF